MSRIYPSKQSKLQKLYSKVFLQEKLNNTTGYIIALILAAAFGYLMVKVPLAGFGLFGLLFGLAIFLACLLSVEAGLYIIIIYCFFAFGFSRLAFDDQFPVGVVLDVLIFATFLGMFMQKINLKKNFNEFIQKRLTIWVLLLLAYLFIELFNPYAKSFDGWYQSFRRTFESVILFFIAFNAFSSTQILRRFIKVLFAFCVMVGLYGCIQQWHGLFEYELKWAMAEKVRFGLLFIGGDFRKFSTTSDATAFGILMASASIFYAVIALGVKQTSTRIIIFIGIAIMILGMAYSGTRTANAMIVAGLAFYVFLDFARKSTRIFSAIAAIVLIVILYGPFYSNPTINRFRSTFEASKDESYLVRERNRKFIQPYIYSHPIGGGLGTTDANGLKFNAGHYLAGFPTDSGYLKKALETGWIGLIIICIVYFIVLRTGIRGYFKYKDPSVKILYAATTCAIFTFYLAEFPQNAVGQITDVVVYYPFLAVLLKAGANSEKTVKEEEKQPLTSQ